MRLIPPPEKTARTTQAYSVLLKHVLNVRLLLLVKLLFFACWPLGVLLRVGAWSRPSDCVNPVAGLLLMGILVPVLGLRKTDMRVYAQTHPSLALELKNKLLSKKLLRTWGAYGLSAILYFRHFVSSLGNLKWYTTVLVPVSPAARGLPSAFYLHRPGDLHYINERFSFEFSFLLVLSLVFAVLCVLYNRDVVSCPPSELGMCPRKRLARRTSPLVLRVLSLVLFVNLTWPVFYWTLHRLIHSGYYFAGILGFNVSGTTGFPGVYFIFIQTFVKWVPLVLLWEFTNVAFTIYLSAGPLHRGQPISDLSRDPNGSLLLGLEHKNGSLTQLVSWEELNYISENLPERRVSIFEDVSSGRVLWQEIHKQYETVAAQLITRLGDKEKPAGDVNSIANKPHLSVNTGVKNTILQPSDNRNIFQKSGGKPLIARLAAKIQDDSTTRLKTVEKSIQTGHDLETRATDRYRLLIHKFLESSWGVPFRHTVSRDLAIRIGDATLLDAAFSAIGNLVSKSSSEDPMGYVQTDIAPILANLDIILTLTAKWKEKPSVHWTNIPVAEGTQSPNFALLDSVAGQAEAAFNAIAVTFKPYFHLLPVSTAVKERALHL